MSENFEVLKHVVALVVLTVYTWLLEHNSKSFDKYLYLYLHFMSELLFRTRTPNYIT